MTTQPPPAPAIGAPAAAERNEQMNAYFNAIARELIVRACIEGGATLDAVTPWQAGGVRGAYLVGGATGDEFILRADATWRRGIASDTVIVIKLAGWLERCAGMPEVYGAFGSWHNTDSGMIHVDAVTTVNDYAVNAFGEACSIARERQQLAFGHIGDDGIYTEFVRVESGEYLPAA